MTVRLPWPIRARIQARRIVSRIPRDVVSPLVRDDELKEHQALFDLLGAFVGRRTVLFDGLQAAYGAVRVQNGGAAEVVGLVPARARRFARRHFSTQEVFYPDGVPHGRRFDVLIRMAPALGVSDGLLANDGKLLVVDGDERALQNFTTVMRFGRIVLATNDPKWHEPKLNIGSGPATLPDWINIDNRPYPGVDLTWDLANGIPVANARFVFAEHFVEHLPYPAAARFLADCRRVLKNDGVLRLSTPNLDWVWRVSYHPERWTSARDAQQDCFIVNRAFRGWGHQFLYNRATLTAALRNAGFADVRFCAYGESSLDELRGLERHERYVDDPAEPHVLVVEASGRHEGAAIEGEDLIRDFERDLLAT